MKRYFADKTCLNLIRLLILVLLLGILILARVSFFALPALMWGISLGALLIGFFYAFIYVPLYFKSAYYYISATEIVKHSGVFFRRRQTVRRTAVQYVMAISTPFSRKSGLNFLQLHAFGGSLLLPFLSWRDMDEIQKKLRTAYRGAL